MQEVDGTRIPELKSIVCESLQLAGKLGASQAEADVSLQKGLTTTVRLGEVETVEYQRDRGMGITVYFGKRKGSANTADLSPRALTTLKAVAASFSDIPSPIAHTSAKRPATPSFALR